MFMFKKGQKIQKQKLLSCEKYCYSVFEFNVINDLCLVGFEPHVIKIYIIYRHVKVA